MATEHPFKSDIIKEKIRNTKIVRYNNENFVNLEKREKTNLLKYGHKSSFGNKDIYKKAYLKKIENGTYTHPKNIDDFLYYKKQVWKVTRKQPLHTLKNIDKRGTFKTKSDPYTLDHKYSIYAGFKNNIPTYLIGNIKNLEMLKLGDNSSKDRNCSISIEELFNN
jgi:hypothetical protein